ncbi:MAG TPA: dihydropteroate synthase [Acidimicrobiia bacterium]|jgi:dihydropteroate synthase|nr:dihydropteroate synthase [Acidimicrobiia bacterium]
MPFLPRSWRVRSTTLTTRDHTLVMGILNVTPDSFSDGGRFERGSIVEHDAAVAAGLAMHDAGADIVDVGGESTRPGAAPVADHEEVARVVPVVAALAAAGVVVSIDTSKPAVARAAVAAGAEIVNDVTAFGDPAMMTTCAELEVGVVLMHMQGEPRTMQQAPQYDDVVMDVRNYLTAHATAAVAAGVAVERICIDPGIGFGKTLQHNLELMAAMPDLVATGYPVLLGASRKSSVGAVLASAGVTTTAADRDPATGATTALGIAAGVAAVRVHDVPSTVQVARMADAIVRAGREHDDNRNGTE